MREKLGIEISSVRTVLRRPDPAADEAIGRDVQSPVDTEAKKLRSAKTLVSPPQVPDSDGASALRTLLYPEKTAQ